MTLEELHKELDKRYYQNVARIESIYDNYTPVLSKMYNAVNQKILEAAKAGKKNIFIPVEVFKRMLKNCGLTEEELKQTDINNWRIILEHLYAQKNFTSNWPDNTQKFGLYLEWKQAINERNLEFR